MRTSSSSPGGLFVFIAGLVALTASGTVRAETRWAAAWAAPIGTPTDAVPFLQPARPENATVRNVARVTVGGVEARIRLSNAIGAEPLVVEAATIALRDVGAAIVPGSLRALTFGGAPGVTLAPGTDFVVSDPVAFPAAAQQDVAVSLHVAAPAPFAFTSTFNTSYASESGSGDHTADTSGSAFTRPVGQVSPLAASGYALTAIDLLTDEADGTVVGFGSSSFQGTGSTVDGYDRVLDLLSVRINQEIPSGKQKAIANVGIGGDTLFSGLRERYDRDVLSQTAASGVIVWQLNDIGVAGRTAEQIIDDYQWLIAITHDAGLLVFCPTWPPGSQNLRGEPTSERDKVNVWLRESGACDGVVDWGAVLEHPIARFTYKPQYQFDTIHFNAAGHRAIAEATPISWFTLTPP